MYVAILFLLVGVGTIAFHFLSPWEETPIASNWGYIDDTIDLTFLITGIVFFIIVLFMAYCIYRFRYQKDRRAEYNPESEKLELWLTGLTALAVVALLTPGLFVWNQYVTVPDNADKIEVVGKQWDWSFRLPGKDGKLGTTDVRNITDENPFGINMKDPNGKDDILIEGDDLHLPLGRPVEVLLRSLDVLHDFYVPQFRAKMDMVPGMITYFWFTPTRTGSFNILCFELCGVGHHAMRGIVVIDKKADYDKWLSEQETFAQSLANYRRKKNTDLASNKAASDPVKNSSKQ